MESELDERKRKILKAIIHTLIPENRLVQERYQNTQT